MLLAALLAAVAVPVAIPGPAAATLLSWGKPVLIDHVRPLATRGEMTAISCASRSLCVAVDSTGDVLSTRDPAARRPRWSLIHIEGAQLTSISCPSVSFCAAVDAAGRVLSSSHPTTGDWELTRVVPLSAPVPEASLTAISCASRSLCVALEGPQLLVSRAPSGGARTWKATLLESSDADALSGVSCPSQTFCAVVDTAGNVFTTSRPTAGAGAWHAADIESCAVCYVGLTAISCPSRTRCVALDTSGNAFISSDPSGSPSTWRGVRVGRREYDTANAVSCAPGSLCLAQADGDLFLSTRPFAGRRGWRRMEAAATAGFSGVSCASARLCAAVGSADGQGRTDDLFSSPHPATRRSAWHLSRISAGGIDTITAIACPSRSLCVAGDDAGNIIASTDPSGSSARAWTVSPVDRGRPITALSCPTSTFCAAIDYRGDILTSRRPAGGSRRWRVAHAQLGSSYLYPYQGVTVTSTISCPSPSLCVAAVGNVIEASSRPTGARQAWRVVYDDPETIGCKGGDCPVNVSALACPSVHLCVAGDGLGDVITSTDPAAGPGAWRSRQIGDWSTGAACPSTSFCVISGVSMILRSRDPLAGAWGSAMFAFPGAPRVFPGSCPSAGMCLGALGPELLASTDRARVWHPVDVDQYDASGVGSVHSPAPFSVPGFEAGGVTALACPSTALCVAADAAGNVIVGRYSPRTVRRSLLP